MQPNETFLSHNMQFVNKYYRTENMRVSTLSSVRVVLSRPLMLRLASFLHLFSKGCFVHAVSNFIRKLLKSFLLHTFKNV